MSFTFSLLLAVGIVAGLAWVVFQSPVKQGVHLFDLGMGTLLCALAVSRLGYVAWNWSYFQQHMFDIPQVWLGGLSSAGALLGAWLGLVIQARLVHQSAGELADHLLPLAGMVVLASWLACWLEGSAYGQSVGSAWWGLPAKDESGVFMPRFPTQLLGALITLGLLWVVEKIKKRRKDHKEPFLPVGGAASLAWLGLSLEMLGLSFLRADPVPLWQGIRLDTWGSLGLVVLSLTCCLWIFRPHWMRQRVMQS
jgi:phosphatidylglycerol:prolipoprotein diacylglycerol transferase